MNEIFVIYTDTKDIPVNLRTKKYLSQLGLNVKSNPQAKYLVKKGLLYDLYDIHNIEILNCINPPTINSKAKIYFNLSCEYKIQRGDLKAREKGEVWLKEKLNINQIDFCNLKESQCKYIIDKLAPFITKLKKI